MVPGTKPTWREVTVPEASSVSTWSRTSAADRR
jgi:hypothetical protein